MAPRKSKTTPAVEKTVEVVEEPTADTFVPRKYFVQVSYNNENSIHPEANYLTPVGTLTYYTATGEMDVTQKPNVRGTFMDDLANRDIDVINPTTNVKSSIAATNKKEWITNLFKARLPVNYVASEAQLLYIDE